MTCGDVGSSNVTELYAIKETTCGTLKLPTATDFILPAGFVTAGQEFPTVNSEEMAVTLDILSQFQSAAQPAAFSFPMYMRVPAAASLGTAVQGDAVLESLLGSAVAAGTTTGAVDDVGTWTAVATTLIFDTLAGGWLPDMGVITVGTEQIFYRGITWTSATEGSLLNASRGWNGTTAAIHADDAAFSLTSRYFRQDVNSPSFSLWAKYDHFTVAIAGCSTDNGNLGVNNEGAVTFNIDGKGMRLYFAGTATCNGACAAAQADIDLQTGEGKLYSVGMLIQIINPTTGAVIDDNTNAGYTILSITGDTLTLSTNLAIGGSDNDEVVGMLPATQTTVANVVESKDTVLYLNTVASTMRSTDLAISCPKVYPTDQIGTTYPTLFAEEKRAITGSSSLYFRKIDGKYFSDNMDGTELPIHILFGDTEGEMIGISMRKSKLTNPVISAEGPLLSLAMNLTALGTESATTGEVGENSLDLVTM